jgi:hypothetical protein
MEGLWILAVKGKSDRMFEHAGRKGDDAGAETTEASEGKDVVVVVTSRGFKAKC